MQLKGISGIDVCKELKKTTGIPIILFSAHANLEKTYRECKADRFIPKPFETANLLNVISEVLSKWPQNLD